MILARAVKVDDRMRTTNPHIYAAGDVCSRYKFTHTADFMARIVIQNALFKGRSKVSALTIPWCTYTSPEVAHVGLYDREAKERGMPIDTYIQHFGRRGSGDTGWRNRGIRQSSYAQRNRPDRWSDHRCLTRWRDDFGNHACHDAWIGA